MTVEEMYDLSEKASNDRPINFDLRKIDGLIRLEKLGWDGKNDILPAAEHDQAWLSVDLEWLASVASDDDINYLVDCGIYMDEDYERLYMFV